ncbi:acyl-CoA desaturase [Paucibacter sp. APW11]|uniref:Acyl-CoA desaturase n=1 Tax=Roseateles aquae TaxID=3077235 RepID=A0ABU3P8L4_9BURK|nr:acyl-CoA desaturase [Paucibacter sp. APW11]MDT8998632.1 acyl-CoA desaturase [Paucibacter sp. APW11]
MQAPLAPQLPPERARALWQAMHARIVAQGLTRGAAPRAWLTLALLATALGATLAFCWQPEQGPAALALGSLVLALLLAQFAFWGHNAGHGGVHRRAALNQLLGQLAMTLVTGLAFGEWWQRHKLHHRHCQDEARDPDMAVSVVVSLTTNSLAAKGPVGRWMTRHQAWHLWGLSLFFAHSQRHLAQWGALCRPRRHALDLLVLIAHFALWWALPLALGVPLATVALVYVVPLFWLGPYLALIFWLNHIGMPLIQPSPALSFLEHQAATSRTILNPPAWDWFFGGLNFQIEHHLFPRVPACRLRAVQCVVQEHLATSCLRYHGVSLRLALLEVAAHFKAVSRAGCNDR